MTRFLDIPLEALCIEGSSTVRDAFATIQQNAKQIVCVVDGEGRLLGVITDGDLRRAVLSNTGLDSPATAIMQVDFTSATPDTPPASILELMKSRIHRHIPILDDARKLVDLAWISDLLKAEVELDAVVMAGGHGLRLRPLTERTPKPMLHVGGAPLMERIIGQLRDCGIRQVAVTTHFMSDKIRQHFGDGRRFGVNLRYVAENEPLGTAGSLARIPSEGKPILVINGDIVTDVDFRAMLAFHEEHGAKMTVGVREFDFQLPYGVVETRGVHIRGVQEKPKHTFFVNAGVYLLEPDIARGVAAHRRVDMPELIERAVRDGQTVVSFPIVEYWVDIGKMEDYRRADEELSSRKDKACP